MGFNHRDFRTDSATETPNPVQAEARGRFPSPANSPVATKLRNRQKVLALDEQEQMAGLLATERLKTRAEVYDPFDVWSKAREEILSRFRLAQTATLTAVGHIA